MELTVGSWEEFIIKNDVISFVIFEWLGTTTKYT